MTDADSPSKRRTSSGTRRDARSLALPITAALLIVASVFVDAGSLLVVLRPAGFGPGGDAAEETLREGIALVRMATAGLGLSLMLTAWLFSVAAGRPRPSADSATARPTDRERLALWCLLVVGLGLRVVSLNAGLWYDEVFTLVEYVSLPFLELASTSTSFNNHMLFSLLANLSIAGFGESAWALRLPAMLLGVASLWAIWRVGLEVGSAREALCATALCTLSYHHVWFSQNARGYTGILFLTNAATALFLYARRTRSRSAWLAYAALLALSLYTHLSAGSIFAAHGLIYLADEGWSWLQARRLGQKHALDAWPLLGFAMGVVLTFELYAIVVPQILDNLNARLDVEAAKALGAVEEWKNPLWTLVEILRGFGTGFAALGAAAVAAGLGAIGFLSYARRMPVGAALMALSIPLTALLLIAASFHLWPRYFLTSIGFLALMLVRGLFASSEWMAARAGRPELGGRAGLAAVALILLIFAFALPANYQHPKQAFGEARDWVDGIRRDAPVVTVGLASLPYQLYFAPSRPGWHEVESAQELEALARDGPLFVIHTFPTQLWSLSPDIAEWLEVNTTELQLFPGTLGGGDIHVAGAGVR